MGPFGKIVVLILSISFMTFITFFGRLPALRLVHFPTTLIAVRPLEEKKANHVYPQTHPHRQFIPPNMGALAQCCARSRPESHVRQALWFADALRESSGL